MILLQKSVPERSFAILLHNVCDLLIGFGNSFRQLVNAVPAHNMLGRGVPCGRRGTYTIHLQLKNFSIQLHEHLFHGLLLFPEVLLGLP